MLKGPVSDFEVQMHSELKDRTIHPSRYEFLMGHNGIRPNCLHGLISSTGCLSGDTKVRLNRNGNGRQYNLKELCIKMGNYPGLENLESFLKIKSNRIRSYIKDENRIGLKKFIDVRFSGVKDLFELVLENGLSLKLTYDHEVMTSIGMVPLCELNINDDVMVDVNIRAKKSGKQRKKKQHDLNAMVGKYHPYAKHVNTSRNGVRIQIEKHRVIYEAHINGVGYREFQIATDKPNDLKYIDPSIYHIHHIDFDHENNDPSNLIHMTIKEHNEVHRKAGEGESHFSQGGIEYSKVVSIEPCGTEDTFDVYEVSGTSNFCANDIVVSNSGKSTLLKCIVTEVAAHCKVLLWLSEENIVEYQELIHHLDRPCLRNISFVEEKEIPAKYKQNQDNFFSYFEQMVDESEAEVVFIDNVTSSAFYNQRFGFLGQNRTAEFFMHFVKRKCSIFYIAHTAANITENHNKIITPEDIRGSKELPLVTEYFYIIQKFTTNDKIYNILKVAKFRHHEKAAGFFALKFEKGAYIGDGRVPFELINKIFRGRDYLGRASPKKAKKDKPTPERKGSLP